MKKKNFEKKLKKNLKKIEKKKFEKKFFNFFFSNLYLNVMQTEKKTKNKKEKFILLCRLTERPCRSLWKWRPKATVGGWRAAIPCPIAVGSRWRCISLCAAGALAKRASPSFSLGPGRLIIPQPPNKSPPADLKKVNE